MLAYTVRSSLPPSTLNGPQAGSFPYQTACCGYHVRRQDESLWLNAQRWLCPLPTTLDEMKR